MCLQWELSRVFYGEFRRANNFPPVHHSVISENLRVCSVKGTSFEVELYGYTNAWEAKTECLKQYNQSLNDD